MGREIVCIRAEEGNEEWWIVSTTCEYFSRASKAFSSYEEVIECLEKGGFDPVALEHFKKVGSVSTFAFDKKNGGIFGFTQSMTEALDRVDALCPSGEYSLYEDAECTVEGCTELTKVHVLDDGITFPIALAICWECETKED